jgi:Tol biopolymer transport system component/predicted Ser/Thr protein kinase
MDSLVGKIISHYRIIERIGAGGMGVVYKAEDTKLGRVVALKFLPPEMTRDRKAKDRFVAEARAASAIEHSSICTIFEVDEIENDRIFISMAYYQGKTLKDRIAEGPLEIREALDVASQAAHGLAKAHAGGIVHRDIKPGNIFITEDHEVKIVDFGLAKLAGQVRLTTTGKTMGTVSYMSPEQARGEETGPETDIWALGVVLYEMVTGELPFKGDYDVAVVYSVMNEDPPAMSGIRPGVPEELENIVKKALAKNRAERYKDANELLSDLSALKQALDFETFTGTHEWRFQRKNRKPMIASAAAAAVAIAAVVWWIASHREPPPAGLPGEAHQVTTGDAWQAEPALSPDGSRIAYASDESGNKDIYVSDVSGESKIRLTNDPAPDHSPAWFPDGETIAFVSERGGSKGIWKMPSLGGGATLMIKDAVDPAISPVDGRIAFTVFLPDNQEGIAVSSIADPANYTVLTGANDGMWERRKPAWSPDGTTICYAARQDLWIVPAAGGPARRLSSEGFLDYYPTWSSDGKRIYFSSARGGTLALWRIRAGGGAAERQTKGTSYEQDPTVCRDGSRLAYATQQEPAALHIRNMKTGLDRKLSGMRGDCLPAIAPDASKVIFTSDRAGRTFDLWIQPLEGGAPAGQPQRLTEDTAHASCPTFSPDGKWIAYYRIIGERRDIYTIPAAGGRPIMVTDDPAPDYQPAWSPDGSKLVFASQRDGVSNIWTIPVAEGRPAGPAVRITRDSVFAIAPSWSPDGTRIAYVGEGDVWIVPADGRGPGRKITSDAKAETVRWDFADGSLLVSGSWGEDGVSLRRIFPDGGAAAAINPPVSFGPSPGIGTFDVSLDGRFVAFFRENNRGNIWVHEAKKGTF